MLIQKIIKDKKNIIISFTDDQQLIIRYEVFIKSALRKNDEISEEKYSEIVSQNQLFIAKEQAFRFLGVRLHSIKEIERKLFQKKINQDIISLVINDLTNLGYLDDLKFAEQYSAERIKNKKLGTKKVKQELLSRGISPNIISSLLDGKEQELNEDNAAAVAKKKITSSAYKNLDSKKLRQKLFSYLLSKGFDYESINNTLEKVSGLENTDDSDYVNEH